MEVERNSQEAEVEIAQNERLVIVRIDNKISQWMDESRHITNQIIEAMHFGREKH